MNQKSLVQFIKEKPLKPIILLSLLIALLVVPFVIPYNKELVEVSKSLMGDSGKIIRVVIILFGSIGILVNAIKIMSTKENEVRKSALNTFSIYMICLVIVIYIPSIIVYFR
ncbi:hypothetical protein ABFE25_29010 [Bacillus toyonensis]|uniref:hypothetical protein n=1 Tax=Bacillus toyonensis TaxID=155322 RepID=UPI0032199F23